jgi:hypothetical protein
MPGYSAGTVSYAIRSLSQTWKSACVQSRNKHGSASDRATRGGLYQFQYIKTCVQVKENEEINQDREAGN